MKNPSDSSSSHLLSRETSGLLGSSIAVELPIGKASRVIRGVIVEAKQDDGGTIRIAVEDPDGEGGAPVLIVPSADLEPDTGYGCDYFLSLLGGQPTQRPAESN